MSKNMLNISILQMLVLCGTAVAQPPADLVLENGKIVTVDPEFSVVNRMAVRDGRILALGHDTPIDALIGEHTKRIDLQGRMVLPGLIDSHTHPTGASMYEADHEIPEMDTIADVLSFVRARAKVVPKGEWIRLSQVFITRLREQRYPSRSELDEAAPEHPVVFRTGPDASVNSLALQLGGIDRQFATEHPDNVMVDPRNGEPTGILRKHDAVLKTQADATTKSLNHSQRDDRLVMLLKDYNRSGITGIIDRNCNDAARQQYQRLLDADRLTVRVRLSRGITPQGAISEVQKQIESIASDPLFRSPDPRLGVIGIKCFQDGGMLTGSAYFSRPWGVSSIYGIEDSAYRGMQYIDQRRMEQIVRACALHNLAFTAHCQGDAAVEALINVYERVNRDIPIAPTRSTITHSSFMSPQAIDGAARLGVGIDLQPAWLYLDARTLVAQFGDDRMKYFIPLHSLFEAGVKAGGGSDHMQKIGSLRSVNPYNPFLGMWIAVTRSARWHHLPIHPEQALTREEMIRFYTINNAWLMRMDEEIGSLEVGKRADFVVIDRDILRCPADEIGATRVLSTWLDGRQLPQSQD